MKEPHLLRASSNPRRLLRNIRHLLPPASVALIESAIDENVSALYTLGWDHYVFARRLGASSWRHKVSRLYYAAYNVTRSVRLYVEGQYSQEVKDHQRFADLPDDFPSRLAYANDLPLLRDDRNLCDYDHTATVDELVRSPEDWASFVSHLSKDVRTYLIDRGLKL